MKDEVILHKGDVDSYDRSGSVDRAIKVKSGLFIDHRVDETKRVLFTNFFEPDDMSGNTNEKTNNSDEKTLLKAASSPQKSAKAFRISWTNQEHNLILDSSKEIKARTDAIYR